MRSAMSAAAPPRPDARKRPPSDHVSLHTGWLLTLSRTPVYDATNMPSTAPTTLNSRFSSGGTSGAPRRSLSHASAADTKANNPNARSAHAPTDIGDQYLKLSPETPGVTSTSMCQKRVQLAPRSAVRRIGQMTVATRLT